MGVFFDTNRKVILPSKLFFKSFYNNDINISNIMVRISGDSKELKKTADDLNEYCIAQNKYKL